MSVYDDARAVASELFAEFKQGTVVYRTLTAAAGATPDNPGTPVPSDVPLNATARPVSTKYVDNSHIMQSDIQVTIPNDDVVTPTLRGSLVIDGVPYKIIEIMARPAAGSPVTWTMIVRR